jgi:5-methylcytosine-specific restriction endonuclease McrA
MSRFKKRAIPGPSKIAVARRFGAVPGQTTSASCVYCGFDGEIWWPLTYTGKVGSHMVTSGLEFDHIYPESKGGTSDPENLTLACRPCNRAKKDKVTDAYS